MNMDKKLKINTKLQKANTYYVQYILINMMNIQVYHTTKLKVTFHPQTGGQHFCSLTLSFLRCMKTSGQNVTNSDGKEHLTRLLPLLKKLSHAFKYLTSFSF